MLLAQSSLFRSLFSAFDSFEFPLPIEIFLLSSKCKLVSSEITKRGYEARTCTATTYRLSCCMICISYYLRALIERISIGFEFKTWINSFFHLLMRTLKLYTYDTIKKLKKCHTACTQQNTWRSFKYKWIKHD